MNILEVKHVPFYDDDLVAVRSEDGAIWAAVRWMCDGMGLSRNQRDFQIQKIKADSTLSKGADNFPLPTAGGKQDVFCLKLDFVPLWLAKINITSKMRSETPELAKKLEDYQLKAKDVLAKAFLKQKEEENYLALPKDYPSALRALADSYEENEKLKIENNKLRTYVDTILESKEALTMTQIAKDYDMTCQQANRIANEEGIQYKVNDQWVLYKKYMGKGYTTSETFCKETNGEVFTKVYTKWTQKGRLMLHEVFTKRGILPHMDKEIANS